MDNPYDSPQALERQEDLCPLCGMNCAESEEPLGIGVDGARLPMLLVVLVLVSVVVSDVFLLFRRLIAGELSDQSLFERLQLGGLLLRIFASAAMTIAAWSSYRVSGRFREFPLDNWVHFWQAYRFFWQVLAGFFVVVVVSFWGLYFYAIYSNPSPLLE